MGSQKVIPRTAQFMGGQKAELQTLHRTNELKQIIKALAAIQAIKALAAIQASRLLNSKFFIGLVGRGGLRAR